MPRIRVVIADDHALLREGLRALLKTAEDIEVVGEAADGLEAIEACRKLGPDVVLMDIAMPGLGGLEAALEVRKVSPHTRVLVLTQYDDREYVSRFLKAGAAGYILKKAAGTELVVGDPRRLPRRPRPRPRDRARRDGGRRARRRPAAARIPTTS